jgi:rhodanese-related sulfurtransferase
MGIRPVFETSVPTVDVGSVPADAVLLDVREDDEWAAGHIAGAVHVPMMRLPQRLQYEPGELTPQRPIVVVCKMGGRSAQVTAWLRHQGYDAANLAGGMLAWEAAGRPMHSEGVAEPAVL